MNHLLYTTKNTIRERIWKISLISPIFQIILLHNPLWQFLGVFKAFRILKRSCDIGFTWKSHVFYTRYVICNYILISAFTRGICGHKITNIILKKVIYSIIYTLSFQDRFAVFPPLAMTIYIIRSTACHKSGGPRLTPCHNITSYNHGLCGVLQYRTFVELWNHCGHVIDIYDI